MRLEKIKLAGFKSFVDPTTITLPSELMGIVGPNGCGKSNVIDAVRWVMGEISAKQLRGESLTDVIFNGSRDRQPVGQASIELIFDNSDGTIGGEYAEYSQIAIRRVVSRDAQSNYFLNGAKCRRKDIIDVFLGTGLGPRSYSIIEQGMISELVESKPEELRGYLEEVAGISKYRERRRETENRIRHTRDNLARVNDLREELGTQLNRLKRQARAAERYKVLKSEERLLRAQLLAIRWTDLNEQLNNFHASLGEQTNLLESHRSALQSTETEIEKNRQARNDHNDEFNSIQSQYYAIGGEVARIEQAIQHQKERKQQLEMDLVQMESTWQEAHINLTKDKGELNEAKNIIQTLEPEWERTKQQAEASQSNLYDIELAMHEWQIKWDEFNQKASEISQTIHVQEARIQHLSQQKNQVEDQLAKMDQAKQEVNVSQLKSELENLTQENETAKEAVDIARNEAETFKTDIQTQRSTNQAHEKTLADLQRQLQETRGEHVSLKALQKAALGENNEKVLSWMENHQLHDKPRLAQGLQVDAGWEKSVETVLGSYLEAICIDGVDGIADVLHALEYGAVTLFDIKSEQFAFADSSHTPLNQKVQSNWPIANLLNGVYVSDSLNDALSARATLQANESIITRDGIWLGKNWLRVSRDSGDEMGVIEREQKIRDLKQQLESDEINVKKQEQILQSGQNHLINLEKQLEQKQLSLADIEAQYVNSNIKKQVKENHIRQIIEHNEKLVNDISEHHQHIEAIEENLQEAYELLATAKQASKSNESERVDLTTTRDELREKISIAREKTQADKEILHSIELRLQTNRSKVTALEASIERIINQTSLLQERREQLRESLTQDEEPLQKLQDELNEKLNERLLVEKTLNESKHQLEEIDQTIQSLLQKYRETEQEVETARNSLSEKQLEEQTLKVRQNTLQEQLTETNFTLEDLLNEMPEDATEPTWQEHIEKMSIRISRLGPINLAAITEYEQISERKVYLDTQNEDLEEALETLQNAIRKMDRETRTRFKATFDKVNETFSELFPRVFGGGRAMLELVGDDLLTAGVSLIARPPGKRINSIHLMSGGEKALTAIALVFSLFQLNPSPFCMLDEVDAPLDDANVIRFCNLVKEMSGKIQFIFISHNKSTIEMAKHLTGVTMHEPGVSRIVDVDIDEAIAMAEE